MTTGGVEGGTGARRTQRQRRESTIAALVSAAEDAIVDLGAHGASAQEIARRAGVSQGALFRHFPTRRHVLAATADQVSAELAALAHTLIPRPPLEADKARAYLLALRELSRSRLNLVWVEVYEAARFDGELREVLRPIWRDHTRRLVEIGRAAVGPEPDEERLRLALHITMNFFDGENRLLPFGMPSPLQDDALQVLADLWLEVSGSGAGG